MACVALCLAKGVLEGQGQLGIHGAEPMLLLALENRCTRVEQQFMGLLFFSPPAVKPRRVCGLQVHTVGVGVAIGQSCMLLSAGTKGKRFMLPHATGKLPIIQLKHTANIGIHLVQWHSLKNDCACHS